MLLCQFLVLAGNWQFFCCGRKVLLRPEKKVPVICLAGCAVVSVFGSGDYDRKNKSSSRLSGGLFCCVRFWFWREIGSFFNMAGKFFCCGGKVLLRPEIKNPVICLAGCAVVSVFGCGDYDQKKSSSRLSGGLCCCVSFWFWREMSSFVVVA